MEARASSSFASFASIVTFTLAALVACGSDPSPTPSVNAAQGGAPGGAASNAPTPTSDSGAPGSSGSSEADAGAAPGGPPPSNGFPAHWIDGTACGADPDIQTWQYDDRTFILRESLCKNFEGPFVYLLVGTSKAMLIDAGTGHVNFQAAVTKILQGLNVTVDVVVAHSHAHGDHVNGDGAFSQAAHTTIVGHSPAAAYQFFGVSGTTASTYDLGDRVLDVLPIPGHEAAHLAFYDRRSRVLFTGDTLYPGRLYINDWQSYQASVARLAGFVTLHPVTWVLGGHIELPASGQDYAMGATVHAKEHALELTTADLVDLNTTVSALGQNPTRTTRPNFIVYPLN